MKTTSNNGSKTRGKPFQPGNNFGKGRPAGSRNKATLVLEALIEGQGEEIINTIIASAKDGDMTAAKALLDRLVPTRKSSPPAISLSPAASTTHLEGALFEVFNHLADQNLAPEEAAQITSVIASHIKLHETLKLEDRILQLEQKIGIAKTDTTHPTD